MKHLYRMAYALLIYADDKEYHREIIQEGSMVKGIHALGTTIPYWMVQQELISQNLSNAGTNGYKGDRLFMRRLSEALRDRAIRGEKTEAEAVVQTDYSQGVLVETHNPFDLALEGEGYFEIHTPRGPRYTRNGAFSITGTGELCTVDGHSVAGHGGIVRVGDGDFAVDDGGVAFVDGAAVGRLKIVSIENKDALVREGNSLFRLREGSPGILREEECRVHQGCLEKSNVNMLKEMVEMMTTFRRYETTMKAIQIQSGTIDRAINEVGKTR
jgi:flagellar basal-body rod protein FlgG